MTITHDDLRLTDDELRAVNDTIAKVYESAYGADTGEDPPDSWEVTFSFTPGFGRTVEISLGGVRADVNLPTD